MIPRTVASISAFGLCHDGVKCSRQLSSSLIQIQQHQQRPRLEALRELLASENGDDADKQTATLTGRIRQSASKKDHPPIIVVSRSSPNGIPFPTTSTNSNKLKPKQPMSHNESNIPDSTTRLRLLRERLAEYPVVSSSVLTDSFGRHHNYLRLSLTERCNLRCTYCMPEQGVPLQPPSHLLTTPELLRLARLFASVGTNKFRLTGGEPTLRSDLVDIVAGLNDIAVSETKSSLSSSTGRSDNGNNNILSFKRQPAIGITTNGIVLAQKLPDLVAAGLTSVNISLDTLHPETFAKLTRRPATYLSRVWDSLETAMSYASSVSSPLTVKLNCVIMRGVNDHEVADFVRLTLQYPGLHVRFIEYMPFADNGWDWSHCVPYAELIQQLNQDHNEAENDNVQLIPVVSDDPHDTTKWYQTKTAALAATTTTSRIGFITSMSQHFCSSCNRLRITADGTIKVCLFDGRNDKDSDLLFGGVFSLRDALRDGWSDLEVQKLIHQAVLTKHEALGGHSDPADIQKDAANNRPMTLIGG